MFLVSFVEGVGTWADHERMKGGRIARVPTVVIQSCSTMHFNSGTGERRVDAGRPRTSGKGRDVQRDSGKGTGGGYHHKQLSMSLELTPDWPISSLGTARHQRCGETHISPTIKVGGHFAHIYNSSGRDILPFRCGHVQRRLGDVRRVHYSFKIQAWARPVLIIRCDWSYYASSKGKGERPMAHFYSDRLIVQSSIKAEVQFVTRFY